MSKHNTNLSSPPNDMDKTPLPSLQPTLIPYHQDSTLLDPIDPTPEARRAKLDRRSRMASIWAALVLLVDHLIRRLHPDCRYEILSCVSTPTIPPKRPIVENGC